MTNEQLDALFRANEARGGFQPTLDDWDLMSAKLDAAAVAPSPYARFVSVSWMTVFASLILVGIVGLYTHSGPSAAEEELAPAGSLPVHVIQKLELPDNSLPMVETAPVKSERSVSTPVEEVVELQPATGIEDLQAITAGYAEREAQAQRMVADSLTAARAAANYKQNTSLATAPEATIVDGAPPTTIHLGDVVDPKEAELLTEISAAERSRTDSIALATEPLTELPAKREATPKLATPVIQAPGNKAVRSPQ